MIVMFNSAMLLIYNIPTISEIPNMLVMSANGVGILVELYGMYTFIRHAAGRRHIPVLALSS